MKKHLIAICNIMLSLAFCHDAFINAEASPRRGAFQKNEYINVFEAIYYGDLEAVKKCPPKAFLRTNSYDETPLHNALRLQYKKPAYPNDIITHIISKAPECINIRNKKGYVPMHDAAQNGRLDIVTILVENKADLTITDQYGQTPLFLAVHKGKADVVAYLAENAPRTINIRNKKGYVPMHDAAKNGSLDIVTTLVKNGAVLTITDPFGNTPLFLAVHEGKADVVKYLAENLAQQAHDTINMHNKEGYVPIHKAAKDGRLDIVTSLAENGANLTIPNPYGETPLFLAAMKGHAGVVAYLAKKAPNTINIPNKYIYVPIHKAAQDGRLDIVTSLVENGADLTITDKYGQTPLFLAAMKGHKEVVAYLAPQAHDTINVPNKESYVPISNAAKDGLLEIVTILVENGAKPTIPDPFGQTPLFLAARYGHTDVVKYLAQQAHDTIYIANQNGWTPSKSAHKNGHHDVVELLAEYDATPNGVNPQNKTEVTFKKRFNGPKKF